MTEVNSRQPSGTRDFKILAPGEPFFFRTHYPDNRLVGGGFFSDSARLRVCEAWVFSGEDPVTGCLLVRDVRFFPDGGTADPPPRFARNIVQGKSYDLADPAVAPFAASR